MDKISLTSYVDALGPEAKHQFDRIQAEVMAQCPDAELTMSYGLPTFKHQGKIIIHFGVFTDHMSLFPGAAPIEALADKLAGYKTSKGTIQFSQNQPISDELLTQIVSLCVARASAATRQH